MSELTVSDVMTADVITARPATLFKELAELLTTHRIGAVPVVDDRDVPLGVVSETDLLARQLGRTSWFALPRRRRAGVRTATEMMSRPAHTIGADQPMSAAARTMAAKRLRRLFVVGADGELVGVVSRSDILRTFLRPDADIAEEIRAQVLRLDGAGNVAAEVFDGVATLSGLVETRSTAELTCQLARAVPGVVTVQDEVRYQFDDLTVPGP